MTDLAALEAVVHGSVQGIFFRAFVRNHARRLDITGYAANMPDGRSVEVFAEGRRDKLTELLRHLHHGPPGARVERVDSKWSDFEGRYPQFTIK